MTLDDFEIVALSPWFFDSNQLTTGSSSRAISWSYGDPKFDKIIVCKYFGEVASWKKGEKRMCTIFPVCRSWFRDLPVSQKKNLITQFAAKAIRRADSLNLYLRIYFTPPFTPSKSMDVRGVVDMLNSHCF